jgi:beta-phosphoglucomutase family hydrolase
VGQAIDWKRFRAVLFDLDGVLTDTARIHSEAWKQTFDEYLGWRQGLAAEEFIPFDREGDYLRHVDGKPRYEGVDSFLRSRSISLPWGSPDDEPGYETVCAIGNKKNALVGRLMAERGVDVYPTSKEVLSTLQHRGIRLAVVTSSANAAAVLESAGLADFFEVMVDGIVAASLRLRGKPHPDPFLTAAGQLQVTPDEAIVVEDAISGIKAGIAGGFGLVVGVARHGNGAELEGVGAHLVVSDVSEMIS